MVEKLIGMFSPYADLSRGLQETLQLDRLPTCRNDHGRLEILLRGAGLTDRTLEERVTVAQQITNAARPLLRLHRKREHRRYAERAIAVVFEDEQIASSGIATMRFTFLASHDNDAPE